MANGQVDLNQNSFNTHEGIEQINRMFRFLFDNISGDGEQVRDLSGFGSPESVVVASIGSTYRRLDGGASTTLYVKESGSASTGWIAK